MKMKVLILTLVAMVMTGCTDKGESSAQGAGDNTAITGSNNSADSQNPQNGEEEVGTGEESSEDAGKNEESTSEETGVEDDSSSMSGSATGSNDTTSGEETAAEENDHTAQTGNGNTQNSGTTESSEEGTMGDDTANAGETQESGTNDEQTGDSNANGGSTQEQSSETGSSSSGSSDDQTAQTGDDTVNTGNGDTSDGTAQEEESETDSEASENDGEQTTDTDDGTVDEDDGTEEQDTGSNDTEEEDAGNIVIAEPQAKVVSGWYMRTVATATLPDGRVFQHNSAGVFGELDESQDGLDKHDISAYGTTIFQVRFINEDFGTDDGYFSDYRSYTQSDEKRVWTFQIKNQRDVDLSSATFTLGIEGMYEVFKSQTGYIETVSKDQDRKNRLFLVDVDNGDVYSYRETKNLVLKMDGKHTRTFRWVIGHVTEEDKQPLPNAKIIGKGTGDFQAPASDTTSKFGTPPQ